MDYIDPHIHMVSRVTDDYESLARMGCVAVSEPAFWAGFDRGSVDGFRDYFRQLTQFDDAELTRYRRDFVGFVFQFYNLIPSLTAQENIFVSMRSAGVGRKDAKARAAASFIASLIFVARTSSAPRKM